MGKPIVFAGKDSKLLTGRDLLGSDNSVYAKWFERNYLAAMQRSSGWSVSGSVTVADDTTAADLPRPNTNPIAIKFAATGAGYAYARFTLDPCDYNTKLKVEFAQNPLSGYVAGDFQVDVYSNTASNYGGTSTRLSLSTDSSAVSALPNMTGVYRTTFDAPGSAAPYMEVRITRAANSHSIVLSDIVVGPGTVVQGAAIGDWQSYTPTFTGFGTPTAVSFSSRRNGSVLEIQGIFTCGSTTGVEARVSIALGSQALTIDSNVIPSGSISRLGFAGFSVATAQEFTIIGTGGQQYLKFGVQSSTNAGLTAQAATTLISSGQTMSINARVPIAEWAGAGTVIVQNDVEYAYNTSTSTTTSDTTSFGYGQSGAQIQSITAALARQVRFQAPIQVSDKITLEISSDQSRWVPAGGLFGSGGVNIDTLRFDGTNIIGAGVWNDSTLPSTDVKCYFGKYSSGTNTSWATPATYYWRLKKEKAGAAVGFGTVNSTSAGLMPSTNANLDDSTATRLGLKRYLDTGSYNGGGAPTLTCGQAGFTTTRVICLPYQAQDGTWRLKFNLEAGFTASSSVTQLTITIAGVTFKSSSNQALCGSFGGSTVGSLQQAITNGGGNGQVFILQTSPGGIGSSSVFISGDAELNSKPTWAY